MRRYDLESLFEPILCDFPRVKLEHEINIIYKPIKIEVTNEKERTKVLNEMVN